MLCCNVFAEHDGNVNSSIEIISDNRKQRQGPHVYATPHSMSTELMRDAVSMATVTIACNKSDYYVSSTRQGNDLLQRPVRHTLTFCIHTADESMLVMHATLAATASYVLPPHPNSK